MIWRRIEVLGNSDVDDVRDFLTRGNRDSLSGITPVTVIVSHIRHELRQEEISRQPLESKAFIQSYQLSTTMKPRSITSFAAQFERLSIASTPLRPRASLLASSILQSSCRPFSQTAIRPGNWLLPSKPEAKRSRKGRPRVPTGGSARGTTIVWGDYGLRMSDHHRRVSAHQLRIGEEAIKVRLKGMKYRLYKRVSASIGVYASGNEVRKAILY